jgi:hypothetical protein
MAPPHFCAARVCVLRPHAGYYGQSTKISQLTKRGSRAEVPIPPLLVLIERTGQHGLQPAERLPLFNRANLSRALRSETRFRKIGKERAGGYSAAIAQLQDRFL